jgi:hypothetical protein
MGHCVSLILNFIIVKKPLIHIQLFLSWFLWLGRTVIQRYKGILSLKDAVTEAAAGAISFGWRELALEWLEQGRSIVWRQVLQLRTPVDELWRHHPTKADELERVSRALESAGTINTGHSAHDPINDMTHSLEKATQAHRRLAEDYDRLLRDVCTLPKFNTFLQPGSSDELCQATISGPVEGGV